MNCYFFFTPTRPEKRFITKKKRIPNEKKKIGSSDRPTHTTEINEAIKGHGQTTCYAPSSKLRWLHAGKQKKTKINKTKHTREFFVAFDRGIGQKRKTQKKNIPIKNSKKKRTASLSSRRGFHAVVAAFVAVVVAAAVVVVVVVVVVVAVVPGPVDKSWRLVGNTWAHNKKVFKTDEKKKKKKKKKKKIKRDDDDDDEKGGEQE